MARIITSTSEIIRLMKSTNCICKMSVDEQADYVNDWFGVFDE